MRISFVASLLACAPCAQPVPHPTTIPEVLTGTFAGTASSFPLGRTGGLMQYWYRSDCFRSPSIVLAIGPRPNRTATGAGRTQSVEITMVNTTIGYLNFSKTFAQNLGAQAVVVHTRKPVSIPPAGATSFDAPLVWMQLDVPFVLLGPNLVIQIDLGTCVGAMETSGQYGDIMVLSGTGKHMTSDPSCGGALAASATTTSYTLTLTGAPASQPAWFVLSGNASTSGGLSLPYKLDALNMPGCLLSLDPLVTSATTTDSAGRATLVVPALSPSSAGIVYGQAVHASSANPFGLATTNLARTVLGATGYVSYIYNFTLDGPVAQYGPFTWADALLLKP